MTTINFLDGTSQLDKDEEILRLIETGMSMRNLNPDHITANVVEWVAENISGFRQIPQQYLTDALLELGMSYFRAKSADVHLTADYKENYRLAAIKKMVAQEYSLAAFNSDLIDKRMILVALDSHMIGDFACLTHVRPSEIDDEVALALLENNYRPFITAEATRKFSLSTWVKAIEKKGIYWEGLAAKQEYLPILKQLLTAGLWPEDYAGKKPEGLKDAITKITRQHNSKIKERVLSCYIKSFPMEETLPLLKAKSRIALRDSLYSTEELMPYLKQFPFLKAGVLESSLGL